MPDAENVEARPTVSEHAAAPAPSTIPHGAQAVTGGQIWATVLGNAPAGQVRTILQSAEELWEDGGRAYLQPSSNLRRSAEHKFSEIRDLVREVCGPDIEVELVEPESGPPVKDKPAAQSQDQPVASSDVSDDPLVRKAQEAFGATITNVQRKETRHA